MKEERKFRRVPVPLIFLALCAFLLPRPASSGGIALYEIGIRETGSAAAGWASRADDASTLFTNPAGMTRLEKSEFLSGGMGLYTGLRFSPDSRTTTTGTRGDTSQWLPSGNLYYVHSLSKDLKVGVGVLGYFGLSLDYGDNWVGRYYVQSATLQGLTIQPSVAYKVTDRLSFGAGLNMMNGTLEQKVAINNIAPRMMDGQLKISDNTWGYGANLGVLYELNKKTRFGLNYLSEVKLDFKDTPQFNGIGPGIFTVLRKQGPLELQPRPHHVGPPDGHVQLLPRVQRPLGLHGQHRLAAVVEIRQGRCLPLLRQPGEPHHRSQLQGYLAFRPRRTVPHIEPLAPLLRGPPTIPRR